MRKTKPFQMGKKKNNNNNMVKHQNAKGRKKKN